MASDGQNNGQAGDRRMLIVGIVVIIVLVIGVIASISLFKSGQEKTKAGSPLGQDNVTDGLLAEATVTSVDPAKSEMVVRLALAPQGSFDDAGLLARPVTLFFTSPDGTKQIDMKTGKPLAPIDLNVPLIGDTVSSYPWDKYEADMDLLFLTTDGSRVPVSSSETSGSGGGATTTTTAGASSSTTTSTPAGSISPAPSTTATTDEVSPATSEGAARALPAVGESALGAQTPDTTAPGGGSGNEKPAIRPDTVVPVELTVFTNIPAYTVVELQDTTPNNDGVIEAVFNVNRASTAIAYSLFVSGLMWVLALGVMFLAIAVLLRKTKMELAIVSVMGVILFAMPAALRSFQPAIPPPGVFSDFYSFFWCLGIVAISLVTMIFTYLRRGPG